MNKQPSFKIVPSSTANQNTSTGIGSSITSSIGNFKPLSQGNQAGALKLNKNQINFNPLLKAQTSMVEPSTVTAEFLNPNSSVATADGGDMSQRRARGGSFIGHIATSGSGMMISSHHAHLVELGAATATP